MNHTSKTASLTAGFSLLMMAVISPIAVFYLIPQGQHSLGALLIFAVVALDLIAAVALWEFSKNNQGQAPLLATAAAAFRISYATLFAFAASNLSTGNVEAFQQIWDSALLIFGLHLILLSVSFIQNKLAPIWLTPLIGLAGLGYIFDSVQQILKTQLSFSVGEFTFIGEVALLIWLIITGFQKSKS